MNAYPEKPLVPYQRTTVAMMDVIAYLRRVAAPLEVKRSTYVIFRNESANGTSGVNNNYAGVQADGGRWPAQFDDAIVGVVAEAENGTGRERLFVAFGDWTASVDFLINRVTERGLYIGGTTHLVLTMAVGDDLDLARAYHKEWVTGSAAAEPSAPERASFLSMYGQAMALFRDGAPLPAPVAVPATPPASDDSADQLNAIELAKDQSA